MTETINCDICIIGGGSGGLSVAAGASQMGAKTVLVEKGKMGGDCLNYGCVPSKAIIAAGHAAQSARMADRFGIHLEKADIHFDEVNQHIRAVIKGIEPHDSVERFEGLGVTVIQEAGRFLDAKTLQAGDTNIRAKYFVVATGSSAFVPPVPGLDTVPYLTNETLFDLKERPEHLIVVGGGPIGLEMAQAHRRLRCKVTVLEMAHIMAKDDPELVDVIRSRLLSERVHLREETKLKSVRMAEDGQGVIAVVEDADGEEEIVGSHLLMAVGRKPNVDGLDLEKAGVEFSPRGIEVDARLRSSNKRIFAIGDVAGGLQFTHVAGYHAGVVIKNALFKLPAKADHSAIPWVTYTDPELATVGVSAEGALKQFGADNIRILRWAYHENDRARTELATEGFIKVITDKKGRIIGASIAGLHAGELIMPWVMAVQDKMKISKMAGYVAPYPTLSEVSKRVAGSYFTAKLFSDKTKKLVRFLLKYLS